LKGNKAAPLVDPLTTHRLVLRTAHASHAATMHTYLLENRTYLQPWEPLRDDGFFNLDAVTERLRLMEHKAASGEALHVLMRDSDEHRG
jgi:[ribosomal protein S5]-alanine N-acetyltransferase